MMLGAGLGTLGWIAALALPNALPQIVLFCVVSIGTSILNAAVPNAIVSLVPESRTSEAIGTNSVVRGMFAAGTQILAVLLASDTVTAPSGGGAFPSAAAFQLTMCVIAMLTAAATARALLLGVCRSDSTSRRFRTGRRAMELIGTAAPNLAARLTATPSGTGA